MEPLGEQFVIEHIADMQREAAAGRLANAVEAAQRGAPSRTRRTAVRWVSNGLMFVATWLDPSIQRPSYGRE
jgi:hypothetical protein